MLFAEISPDATEELLEELKQTADAKWYQRVKMIHLSSQQTPVPEIATSLIAVKRPFDALFDSIMLEASKGSAARPATAPPRRFP